ncbi:MAG: bifunctional UDP-sugar hydrolase/5'-nucleotidase [Gammaproteobacteria bacterium]|nr:bifunctional UDP-sugar hydrolase/5'-nucleotidase [Gammaproteobacteria bacterium]
MVRGQLTLHFRHSLHAFCLGVFCFSTLYLVTFSTSANAELLELVIIHTNDFHGHIKEEKNYAGAARISAFVQQQRARYPRVIFLDAGDAISGTPVSTMFHGLPIFELMNAMNYDVGLLGNHEFDHGYKQIEKFREIAKQPLLSANALDPNGKLIGDKASHIIEVKGITIGIIGVITDTTPDLISPLGNEGISFLDPETVLKEKVREIKPKVDLLVVLSHVGHEQEKALAAAVQGIDIIVGGHSHTYVETPVKIGSTYVAQAHRYGSNIGFMRLTVDTTGNSITEFTGKLVPAAELPEPDPAVLATVNFWEEKVEDLVDVEIATSSREILPAELQGIFEKILADAAGADFGYYNIGGIRDSLPIGSITARHIWNIEPFGNTLVTLTIKGSDYLLLLGRENELHPGMAVINANKTYLVATNSFIGAHAVKAFGPKVQMKQLGVLVRDVLIENIKENGLE